MTSKWTNNNLSTGNKHPALGALGDQTVVILLHGKNSFGDKIYSYIKLSFANLQNLKAAIKGGSGFNPSDFGEVVAAGRGEPSEEVRSEVASIYRILDDKTSSDPIGSNSVAEKKDWDEY